MAGDPPQPRLCHIRKVDNFDGYGFNLHAEKNKPGQFVGKIDADSPAEKAGLKEGDRIVEVNGANVNQENHKQVVTRIKSIENETTLLVVDKVCEDYHKQHGIVVKSSLSYVKKCSNSDDTQENIYNDNTEDETIDTRLQEVTIEDCHDEDSDISPSPTVDEKRVRDNSFTSNNLSDRTSIKSGTRRSSRSSMSTSPSTSPSPSSPSPSDDKFSGLDLPGTAAEMKMRISAKKKKDPRKDNRMDFNRKHQIIQSL